MTQSKRVYIVIVNWNGWQDTIECLESVFRNDYRDYRVIVCDNNSSDGSIEHLKEWAEGRNGFDPATGCMKHLTEPPVLKPISYREYHHSEFLNESSGSGCETPLVIVRTDSNLGFAGGNNVALRFLMQQTGWGYVWLLNNDTVFSPDALTALVRRMEESPGAGMCGSLLPYYDKPDTIWAQGGGNFNRWLAKPACIGNGFPVDHGYPPEYVEEHMKYVAGASLLVTREFIDETGLLSEDYFLYFEEPDWSFRGMHRFGLVYAPESIVYHKVGMSTHKGTQQGCSIDRPEDYVFRNSLRFTLTFFPCALPFVLVRVTFNRIMAWFASLLQKNEKYSETRLK